jgi:uncharacterized membrane protein
MIFTTANILLLLTATTSALMAGLFYAWSCSVIPGLKKLPDNMYINAMQSFNRTILNPVFFIGFMGTLILLPLCTYVHFARPVSMKFWLLLGASLMYIFGVFGITVIGNIPLNNRLDKFDLSTSSESSLTQQRKEFEMPWIRRHTIRTVCAIIVIMLVITACLS